jgi:hypothetical protein
MLLHAAVALAAGARDDRRVRMVDWLRDHRPPAPIVAEAQAEAFTGPAGDTLGADADPPIDVRVYAGMAAHPYRAGRLGSALGAGAIGWGLAASVVAIGPLGLAIGAASGAGWYAFVRRPGFRHVRYPTCTLRIDRDRLVTRDAAIAREDVIDIVRDPDGARLRVMLRRGGDALVWRGLPEHTDWIEALVRAALTG